MPFQTYLMLNEFSSIRNEPRFGDYLACIKFQILYSLVKLQTDTGLFWSRLCLTQDPSWTIIIFILRENYYLTVFAFHFVTKTS